MKQSTSVLKKKKNSLANKDSKLLVGVEIFVYKKRVNHLGRFPLSSNGNADKSGRGNVYTIS